VENTFAPLMRTTPRGVLLDVRVIPRASKMTVGGSRDGRLLIRVTAPPVDGAANAAAVAALAQILRLPRQAVRLVAGETSRNKSVEIVGLELDDVRRRLGI
jgi:uncharacterized protein